MHFPEHINHRGLQDANTLMGEQGSQASHRRQCRTECRRLGERRQWSEQLRAELRRNEGQGAGQAASGRTAIQAKERRAEPRGRTPGPPLGQEEPLRKERRRPESARPGRGAGPDHLPPHRPLWWESRQESVWLPPQKDRSLLPRTDCMAGEKWGELVGSHGKWFKQETEMAPTTTKGAVVRL